MKFTKKQTDIINRMRAGETLEYHEYTDGGGEYTLSFIHIQAFHIVPLIQAGIVEQDKINIRRVQFRFSKQFLENT